MARLAPDTQQGRKVDGTNVRVVREAAPGGMRKLRTPNHQLAVPQPQRDGTTQLQTRDGTVYRSRPMK